MPSVETRSPSAFGQSLKSWRLTRGLTQEELAERAGISARLVSDLERGVVQRPRADTATMVADALELSGVDRGQFLAARQDDYAKIADETRPSQPHPETGLIGREKEAEALREMLAQRQARLITLTGMGGVGKTTLASAVAQRVATAFPGGVHVIELAALHDDRLILATIATASAKGQRAEPDDLKAISASFLDGPALLVLDNLEHLPSAPDAIAQLLHTIPDLTILATSREPMRLRGEIEYPLAPLAIPDPEHPSAMEELADVPSVALLMRRASAVRPSFALTEANAPEIAQIVTRLDGVPLAIELAAARLRSLTPFDLAQRLERRLPILTRGDRDLPARHQTMSGAIDWSYQLLPEEERAVFQRLAVFDGGAGLDAAEYVCGAGFPEGVAFDALHSLAEKHLAGVSSADAETRYRMLETVREFGLDRLNDSGESDQIRQRHAEWWVGYVDRSQAGLTGPEQERWIRSLGRDHDNLRAALRWAIAHGEAKISHALSGGLIRFWMTRGFMEEARRWYEEALAIGLDDLTAEHGSALTGYGVVLCFSGEYEPAKRVTEQAREIYEHLGMAKEIGSCFGNLGLIADLQGKWDEATAHYRDALGRFRAVGEKTQAAYMLHNLGMIAYDRGEFDEAEPLFHEAMAIQRALGDSGSVAFSLSSLGQIACARGEYPAATRLQVQALELREAIQNESGIAKCLQCLAEIAVGIGDATRAAWLLGAAEGIRKATGSPMPPVDVALHERLVESSRAAIGRREFTRLWNEGAEAERERVMAVAVGDAGVPMAPPENAGSGFAGEVG